MLRTWYVLARPTVKKSLVFMGVDVESADSLADAFLARSLDRYLSSLKSKDKSL